MVVLMRLVLLTLSALTLAAAAGTRSMATTQAQEPAQPAQMVDVVAERFSFAPSEIKTTVGTAVTIRLTSDDTIHGFRIIGTDVNVEIPKRSRGRATVTFTPDKAGRYTFECSKLCGAGHSFMRGVIVVSPQTQAHQ